MDNKINALPESYDLTQNIKNVEVNTGFILGYNKCLETYQFTASEVIQFKDWCMNIPLGSELAGKTTNELFDIWKQQK